MERKNNEDTRPLWKRKVDTNGKLYLHTPGMDPNRRIKPGQTIRATVKQLGTHLHEFELLPGQDVDSEVEQEVIKAKEAAAATAEGTKPATTEKYSIVSKPGGWFDVLSPEGVKMNEKGLKADAAEALKDKLEAEQPAN